MKYIEVRRLPEGFMLDASVYLDRLDEIAQDLPPGAGRFATDEDHYDFYSGRCIKDLRIERVSVTDSDYSLKVEIEFGGNRFKHSESLLVNYLDVVSISIGADNGDGGDPDQTWPETLRLGEVQLDEILPHARGCSHEIKTISGCVLIICGDLSAQWKGENTTATA